MKEKMKGIPLLAKTSHRLNRQLGPVAPVALQQFRRDPYGSQFLCFRAKFQTLFVHCFPNQHPEVFQELQGRPLYKEKSPRVEGSHAYPSYAGRVFPYRNLALNYTRNK